MAADEAKDQRVRRCAKRDAKRQPCATFEEIGA
jgi:hypothetical protein